VGGDGRGGGGGRERSIILPLITVLFLECDHLEFCRVLQCFILLIFLFSIVRNGNCLWFRRLETGLLSRFAIFSFSIF
jgi:hypothetical protein